MAEIEYRQVRPPDWEEQKKKNKGKDVPPPEPENKYSDVESFRAYDFD